MMQVQAFFQLLDWADFVVTLLTIVGSGIAVCALFYVASRTDRK
jgi:hypothetical protein